MFFLHALVQNLFCTFYIMNVIELLVMIKIIIIVVLYIMSRVATHFYAEGDKGQKEDGETWTRTSTFVHAGRWQNARTVP